MAPRQRTALPPNLNLNPTTTTGTCSKNSFDGCLAMTQVLPIANASAVAVHNTSDSDGLTNTCVGRFGLGQGPWGSESPSPTHATSFQVAYHAGYYPYHGGYYPYHGGYYPYLRDDISKL